MADENYGVWLNFASQCMSDEQWEVAATTREAILSHRSCPWGGHLIKLECRSVFIQNAPKDPCDLFVRPEVRAMSKGPMELTLKCKSIHAPGDAILERTNSMWIIRVASVLFGHCQGSFEHHFYEKTPMSTRHRLYKNFPETGDSIYLATEAIWLARRLADSSCRYRLVVVFQTPEDTFPTWASSFFPAYTSMFHKAAERVLNGPGFQDMRAIDAKMYMVLSMRSFNKGPPLIPQSGSSDDITTVSVGEHLGLASWTRFAPGEKFNLGNYLRCFMQHLGHKMKTYQVMDGRKLVPYQCVVVRHEWEELRKSFFEAFRVQKAAYRHANGGTSTPSLLEDARPHSARKPADLCVQPEVIKTIVRKTFLELEEEEISNCLKRSNSTGEVMTYFV
eukprot:symbB.v1.2.005601.t1/scaffold326.1/size228935/23